MASLLSYAWRRNHRSSNGSSSDANNSNDSIDQVPSIGTSSQSSSEETFLTAVTNDLASLTFEEDKEHGPQNPPQTPEGLRPRRSISFVRAELGLPDAKIAVPPPNTDVAASEPRGFPVVKTYGVLPPPSPISGQGRFLPPCPSGSWSVSHMSSVTNSLYHHNFASWSSSWESHSATQQQQIAHSPRLLPGHARTAVGAAVASFHPFDSTIHYADSTNNNTNRVNSSSYNNEREAESNKACRNQHCKVEFAHTPIRTKEVKDILPSPILRSDNEDSYSLGASPSSRAGDIRHHVHKENVNFSFTSASHTVRMPHNMSKLSAPEPLIMPDSQRVGGTEVVLSTRHRMTALSKEKSNSTVGEGDENSQLDNTILRLKARNQRRGKEELIISALERLQDDVQLVSEIEDINCSLFNWVVKTPMDEESILKGFSSNSRAFLMRQINSILHELNTGMHFRHNRNEFTSDGSNQDLRDALMFGKTLVQMAIPSSEKIFSKNADPGLWKLLPGLRAAVGIRPETPMTQVGRVSDNWAGDSSFFSIPESADTPMTSNVSVATTLTSTVGNARQEHNDENDRRNKTNGLHLRQTITIMSSLLQKLSMTMRQLTNPSSKRSLCMVEQIRSCYLQLLQIERHALKTLVDAFEFETHHVIRMEHEDEEESIDIPRPPISRRINIVVSNPSSAYPETRRYPQRRDRVLRNTVNRFAPISMDDEERIRSFYCAREKDEDSSYFGVDDLRRTTGSSDYDGEEEVRDGCAETPREDNSHFHSFRDPNSFTSSCEPSYDNRARSFSRE